MDLTPLNKFIDKVFKLRAVTIPKLSSELVMLLKRTLEDYIRVNSKYGDVTVTIISINNNNNTLTAVVDINKPGLWFTEFGTGFEGAKTPMLWEYFPTVDLSFYSRGEMQHTHGWEYAYHPQTRKDFGWYYRGEFFTGEPAEYGVTQAVLRIKYEGLGGNLAAWAKTIL